jgi:hypothetical protein
MRRTVIAVAFSAALLLTSCRPGVRTRALPPPDSVDFPRCLAFDAEGNAVACRAPKRTYDGDACICADGYGHAFHGRVQEHPR